MLEENDCVMFEKQIKVKTHKTSNTLPLAEYVKQRIKEFDSLETMTNGENGTSLSLKKRKRRKKDKNKGCKDGNICDTSNLTDIAEDGSKDHSESSILGVRVDGNKMCGISDVSHGKGVGNSGLCTVSLADYVKQQIKESESLETMNTDENGASFSLKELKRKKKKKNKGYKGDKNSETSNLTGRTEDNSKDHSESSILGVRVDGNKKRGISDVSHSKGMVSSGSVANEKCKIAMIGSEIRPMIATYVIGDQILESIRTVAKTKKKKALTTEKVKELEDKAYVFFCNQFEENEGLRKFYTDKSSSVSFDCLLCLSTQPESTKKFTDLMGLLMHTSMRKNTPQHCGYGRAICTLLGWDS